MITEQTKVTVEFTIHELIHIHDRLLIAHDYSDEQEKELIGYLLYRLNTEIPDFAESEDYDKPLKREI